METLEFAEKIAEWADNKKAEDTAIIGLDGLSILADYFVLTSGTNVIQVKAIADSIEEEASKLGLEPQGIEGKNGGRWILMDYGDVVVHVFHEEERSFYDLERLWKEGNNIRYLKDEEEVAETGDLENL